MAHLRPVCSCATSTNFRPWLYSRIIILTGAEKFPSGFVNLTTQLHSMGLYAITLTI